MTSTMISVSWNSFCSLTEFSTWTINRQSRDRKLVRVHPVKQSSLGRGSKKCMHLVCQADPSEKGRGEAKKGALNEGLSKMEVDRDSVLAQVFGSSWIFVWAITLSYAGYQGFQQMQTDPSGAGVLVAPPILAFFLILVFSLYTIISRSMKKKGKSN
mmetsp:Transcript_12211/g.16658  ORF Transcript_12211/g.16658 Transcript_12211/m.16658 type:complete len:157 (+) Transcript_12211:90-560(+)